MFVFSGRSDCSFFLSLFCVASLPRAKNRPVSHLILYFLSASPLGPKPMARQLDLQLRFTFRQVARAFKFILNANISVQDLRVPEPEAYPRTDKN